MKRILAVAAVALLGAIPGRDVPQFTDWGPPENLGPVINSPYTDSCVAISKNGLSLFLSSTRQTGNPAASEPNRDLYVSHRETTDAAWGEPQPLSELNTPLWDSCPALSLDEHRLYFTRPGLCGDRDIWVSRRQNRRDDFGWEPPVNLGCEKDGYVNTPQTEVFPTFFEDDTGKVLMYFGRSGTGIMDLYQSEMREDDTFGPATPLAELNTPSFMEHSVTVRRDGLEVFFGSTRGDGKTMRFWTATRASTADPWSAPILVSSLTINPSGRFAMSFDGSELYFASTNQPSYGGIDLWVARRERRR
jgi:hypothetical protein